MNITLGLKRMILESGQTQTATAGKLGMMRQVLNRKIQAENHRVCDLEEIANVLGFDVKIQFIQRDTGKVIDCD